MPLPTRFLMARPWPPIRPLPGHRHPVQDPFYAPRLRCGSGFRIGFRTASARSSGRFLGSSRAQVAQNGYEARGVTADLWIPNPVVVSVARGNVHVSGVSIGISGAGMLPCGSPADYLPCGTKGIAERCTALLST